MQKSSAASLTCRLNTMRKPDTPTAKPVIRKRDGIYEVHIKQNTFCNGIEYVTALNWVNKLNKEQK